MPATPKRAGRKAAPGSRFLSEALAENIYDTRSMQRLTQAGLAERMQELGEDWTRGTVGQVERGDRTVSVDELGHLALALGVTIGQLLDPTGPAHHHQEGLDIGYSESIPGWWAHTWLRDRIVITMFHGDMVEPRITAAPELAPRAQKVYDEALADGETRPFDPGFMKLKRAKEEGR